VATITFGNKENVLLALVFLIRLINSIKKSQPVIYALAKQATIGTRPRYSVPILLLSREASKQIKSMTITLDCFNN
jgi:hypothetical protein